MDGRRSQQACDQRRLSAGQLTFFDAETNYSKRELDREGDVAVETEFPGD